MENDPEINAEQGGESAAPSRVSLGKMLRETRESLGLSIAEVAAQTKLAPRQIEALEADDFEHLPEPAFVRGFVRSYAKILNMDAQRLLAAMPQTRAPAAGLTPASVGVPFPASNSTQTQNLIMLGAALLLAVVAVGFSVWHFTNPRGNPVAAKIETPVPVQAEVKPVPEPVVLQPEKPAVEPVVEKKLPPKPRETPAATVAVSEKTAKSALPKAESREKTAMSAPKVTAKSGVAATKPDFNKAVDTVTKVTATIGTAGNTPDTEARITTLRLVFEEESWADIKDKDGNTISSQINPTGSELNVKGRAPLSLVIGHAATTKLFQDGQEIDMSPYINASSDVARLTLE